MKMLNKLMVAGMSAALLAGCSSGSGSSDGSSDGTLSLGISDAPMDSALEVVVKFTKVELQPSDGDRITIEFDEIQEIDLLDFQGKDAFWLFEKEEVPAGKYNWIRLYVERDNREEGNVFGTTSYVNFEVDGKFNLAIPSGPQTGLKLVSGFTVPVGGATELAIDVDLRRALFKPSAPVWDDYYFLRPAMRLASMDTVGHLQGEITSELMADNPGCQEDGAVYLYEGHDQSPSDVFGDDGPLTTALLAEDEEGIYGYQIGYLLAGDYTVALTCEADQDERDTDEEIDFIDQQNVDIVVGETTEANFPSE